LFPFKSTDSNIQEERGEKVLGLLVKGRATFGTWDRHPLRL